MTVANQNYWIFFSTEVDTFIVCMKNLLSMSLSTSSTSLFYTS
jgi:hypothetical protein